MNNKLNTNRYFFLTILMSTFCLLSQTYANAKDKKGTAEEAAKPTKMDVLPAWSKRELQGLEPAIKVGAVVTVEFKATDEKTKKVIEDSKATPESTYTFTIGKSPYFNNVGLKMVGLRAGEAVEIVLPPNVGVASADGAPFTQKHKLPLDTTLRLSMKVINVKNPQ